jgi:hypothetical protein
MIVPGEFMVMSSSWNNSAAIDQFAETSAMTQQPEANLRV